MSQVDPKHDHDSDGGQLSEKNETMTKSSQGYDRQEVDLKALVIGGIALLVAVVLSFVAVSFIFSRYQRTYQQQTAAERGPWGQDWSAQPLKEFPHPQLQISPKADLERMRARDEKELNTYGWIDRDRGIVRLPIDRAVEFLARNPPSSSRDRGTGVSNLTPLEMIKQKAMEGHSHAKE
jgi:hypothetical protein